MHSLSLSGSRVILLHTKWHKIEELQWRRCLYRLVVMRERKLGLIKKCVGCNSDSTIVEERKMFAN